MSDRELAELALKQPSKLEVAGAMAHVLTKYLWGEVDVTSRNVAAMTAGFPGDIGNISRGSTLDKAPDSEELIEKFGGDPEHWSYWPAALAAPGPGEVIGGTKAALASMKGIGMIDPSWAMTLFHGTPHKFDKFSLDKIGTGEGAQAYGHGLYFAESPGVAKSYQAQLSGFSEVSLDGKIIKGSDTLLPAIPTNLSKELGLSNLATRDSISRVAKFGDVDLARNEIKTLIPQMEGWGITNEVANLQRELEALDALAPRLSVTPKNPGHLYEVDIPDEITDKMLDWDAPLSEQPESVKTALNKLGYGEEVYKGETAGEMYDRVANSKSDKVAGWISSERGSRDLSKALNEAGIPGIRFYDGSSRSAGEGTRNIVVFNPDDIKQVKRDGELVYKKSKLQETMELVDKY